MINRISRYSLAITTLLAIACDGSNSNLSPNAPNSKENISVSSSSPTPNSSSSINSIEENIIKQGESRGLPSFYGECAIPVSWNSLDTSSTQPQQSSNSWEVEEKYRFEPTGTFCDSLKIEDPKTWKYAFTYTVNNGRDSITGHFNYQLSKSCLLETKRNLFTTTHQSHIKEEKIISSDTKSITMCFLDDCVSAIDIAATFNTIWQQCINMLENENIKFYTNFDKIPIDTSIYIDQVAYDCQKFGKCGDDIIF